MLGRAGLRAKGGGFEQVRALRRGFLRDSEVGRAVGGAVVGPGRLRGQAPGDAIHVLLRTGFSDGLSPSMGAMACGDATSKLVSLMERHEAASSKLGSSNPSPAQHAC